MISILTLFGLLSTAQAKPAALVYWPDRGFVELQAKKGNAYKVRSIGLKRELWVPKADLQFLRLSLLDFQLDATQGKLLLASHDPQKEACGASCAGYLPLDSTQVRNLLGAVWVSGDGKQKRQLRYLIDFEYTAAKKECRQGNGKKPKYCHREGQGWINAEGLKWTTKKSFLSKAGVPDRTGKKKSSQALLQKFWSWIPSLTRNPAQVPELSLTRVATQIEPYLGQCLLPDPWSEKLENHINRGGSFESFVRKNQRLAKGLGISTREGAKPAFDILFLSGPKGWAHRTLPNVEFRRIDLPIPWRNHKQADRLSADEIVTIDALARTLWVEMEDAAYYGGIHYFDAVGRVVVNRALEVKWDTPLKYSFLRPRSGYPEVTNAFDLDRTLLDSPMLRVLRAPKQFSGWNNSVDGARVYHSLLKTLCPRSSLNAKTERVWKSAVKIATEIVLDTRGFMARTPELENNFFYTSNGVRIAGLVRQPASQVSGKKLNPNYLSIWKFKRRRSG